MASKPTFRIEQDSMGDMKVPKSALYGAQTQRAVENFPVSDLRFSRSFIHALGLIKANAAKVNTAAGRIPKRAGQAIEKAAREVARGDWDQQFVVDIFQTGSGTSTNMNANEVISHRANQILGKTSRFTVHPNDHVNMGQSSNDVIPTALHVSAYLATKQDLMPAIKSMQKSLASKAKSFHNIIKSGRTHLMDATPIRLGQEFSGYARQIELGLERVQGCLGHLAELALGGTAVGTGINLPKNMARDTIRGLARDSRMPFREAKNHFSAQAAQDAIVQLSGALKTLAVSITKIANDIRWLGAGPRTGLMEIMLPEVQPGSSIMPGKINPVICESAIMVSVQVVGNDAAIALSGTGGIGGYFELNTMLPLMAHNILQSIQLLANTCTNMSEKCIQGLKANKPRCRELLDRNLIVGTALNGTIGYDAAAKLVKKAHKEGKSIREVAIEVDAMDVKLLDKLLNPQNQVD